MTLKIETAATGDPDLADLVRRHKDHALAHTPPGSGHAVAPEALAAATVAGLGYWLARLDGAAVGCIALQAIAPDHGEIKTMHVVAARRGQGLADALLSELETAAKARGMVRLSLETGQPRQDGPDGFAAARAFYARRGYAPCPPFGPYVDDPFSYCMTKTL